ncbi:MAG: hypothetical protein AB8B81_13300 [Halioglobus sp.]
MESALTTENNTAVTIDTMATAGTMVTTGTMDTIVIGAMVALVTSDLQASRLALLNAGEVS